MSDARFVFEPEYDLRSARVCGYEILPRRQSDAIAHRAREAGWTPRQVAEVDAGTVVSALALAWGLDPAAPVQVDVAADTVVLARGRMRGVLDGRGVAPMLEIGPAVTAAPLDELVELVEAVDELRTWGFRIALDGIGRSFGLAMVDAMRPDVVKPFGLALFANKPAHGMADPPRVADERTPLREAMEVSLSGDPTRGYDDLVLVGPDGACTGVVAVSDLWRSTLRRDPRPPVQRPAPARPAVPVPHPAPLTAAP